NTATPLRVERLKITLGLATSTIATCRANTTTKVRVTDSTDIERCVSKTNTSSRESCCVRPTAIIPKEAVTAPESTSKRAFERSMPRDRNTISRWAIPDARHARRKTFRNNCVLSRPIDNTRNVIKLAVMYRKRGMRFTAIAYIGCPLMNPTVADSIKKRVVTDISTQRGPTLKPRLAAETQIQK